MLLLAHVFAVVAPTCSLAGAVPTAGRPLRAHSVAGLSFASVTLGLLCTELWLIYGAMAADVAQIATNVIWLVVRGALAIAIVVAARGVERRKAAVAVCLAVVGAVVAGMLGATVVATAATLLTVTCGLPQLWLTLRRGPGAGLSRYAVMLSVSSSSSWTIYGLATGDRAVFICSALALVSNTILLSATLSEPGAVLREFWRRTVLAAHLDAVIVRRVTHAVPTLALTLERHLPAAAAGIRQRHRHLREQLARPGVPAALGG